jgi:iron complex transport system substrate-binding protein
MRIVSLTAAATEVVCALGLTDDLVGIDEDADWPPEAASRPIVARHGRSGRAPGGGEPIDDIDADALAGARPDLILAPGAPSAAQRGLRELVERVAPEADVVVLDPMSIEGIFNSIATVGAMTSAEDAALDLVEELRERLGVLEERVQERRAAGIAPVRVVAMTWFDPPFTAGRWVPEQVRRAGGWDLLATEGGPEAESSWASVREVDPDTILLMPAGHHLGSAVRAWGAIDRPPFWREIGAVQRGQVFAVDAASYFSRPGPRAIDGIELLAELFDPDGFVESSPVASWTPVD